jgi:hypothetical protein
MVTPMDASPLRGAASALGLSRRRLLGLAGMAGMGIAGINACAKEPAAPPASSVAPSSAPPLAASSPPALAPLKPAVAPNPAIVPASNLLLCQEAWGASPPRPGGTPQYPSYMTVHHTAVFLGDNANAPGRLKQHQRYHQDSHGWIDIAYHRSVDRNGNIYELRDPLLVGDTATSYDPTGHFLVVCEGNFDEEEVSEEQLNGAALAFAWAAEQYSIPTDRLAGHRDASGDTACPGASLYAHVISGDLRSRVENILSAGPVNLQPFCGPEATAVIADIEAGRR